MTKNCLCSDAGKLCKVTSMGRTQRLSVKSLRCRKDYNEYNG